MSDLAKLDKGDEVALWAGSSWYIEKVERVTATQLVVCGMKFRRTSGQEVGASSWSSRSIDILTEELRKHIIEETARRTAMQACRDVNFRRLSTDQLKRIAAIINESSECES